MNSYRNNRKNRFKSNNERNFRKRPLNGQKNQGEYNSNSEFRHRNPRNIQNASKLVDKYNNLAREALSSGDKILSENYLKHSEHFSRILLSQENSRNHSKNTLENNEIGKIKVETESNVETDNKEVEELRTK